MAEALLKINHKMMFKDYLRWTLFNYFERASFLKLNIIFTIISPFFLWYLIFFHEPLGSAFGRFVNGILFGFTGLLILMPFLLVASAVMVFNSSKKMPAESELVFTQDGIESKTSIGEASLKWDIIYWVYESKSAVYIYLSRVAALIIPKSNFEKPQDVDYALELMRQNLPPDIYRVKKNKRGRTLS